MAKAVALTGIGRRQSCDGPPRRRGTRSRAGGCCRWRRCLTGWRWRLFGTFRGLQFLRANFLSNRVFETRDGIIEAPCEAWNRLVALPETITSR